MEMASLAALPRKEESGYEQQSPRRAARKRGPRERHPPAGDLWIAREAVGATLHQVARLQTGHLLERTELMHLSGEEPGAEECREAVQRDCWSLAHQQRPFGVSGHREGQRRLQQVECPAHRRGLGREPSPRPVVSLDPPQQQRREGPRAPPRTRRAVLRRSVSRHPGTFCEVIRRRWFSASWSPT